MAGLGRSDNPLILQVTARELISNKYKHCICVYTDGSVTTEGVGAAFVVPQLSNLTKKYQPTHVSVFTAELVAILMALNFLTSCTRRRWRWRFFPTRCRRCRPSNTAVSLPEKTSLRILSSCATSSLLVAPTLSCSGSPPRWACLATRALTALRNRQPVDWGPLHFT